MIELNKIYNECCLITMLQMPDKFCDLIVTDPPYNVGKNYGKETNDNKTKDEFYSWINQIWKEIRRVSKGVLITVGMINLYDWALNVEKPEWTGAWLKSNQCSHNNKGGFNIWEPILMYGNVGKIKQDFWNYPIKKQKNIGNHPCPKLLDFWEVLVNQCLENGLVYDPFMGSGTTAVAAKKLKRNYIGSEISKEYCDIIEKRLSET